MRSLSRESTSALYVKLDVSAPSFIVFLSPNQVFFDDYIFSFYGGSGVHSPPNMNVGCVLDQVEYHAYLGFCKNRHPR